MSNTHRFGMFAKYWQPGQVKTRLAKSIGEDKAALVYRAFVETLLLRFASTGSPQVVFSPDDRESEFRELGRLANGPDSWQFYPQGEGDLGIRMRRYFQRAFADGVRLAILIGSDSPTVPTGYVNQARRLLELHEVVLGPTDDGGYYLVAARDEVPPIFSGIDWSTDLVWLQTIGWLQQHRVKFAVLPAWYDVDDVQDLHRLCREIQTQLKAGATNTSRDLEAFHNLANALAAIL